MPVIRKNKKKNFNIVSLDYEQTGGRCLVFYGKFGDGSYFMISGTEINVYDSDTAYLFSKEFFEDYQGDSYSWETEHLIAEYYTGECDISCSPEYEKSKAWELLSKNFSENHKYRLEGSVRLVAMFNFQLWEGKFRDLEQEGRDVFIYANVSDFDSPSFEESDVRAYAYPYDELYCADEYEIRIRDKGEEEYIKNVLLENIPDN